MLSYERRREGLPVIPTVIQAAAGGAQGLIASHDVDAWASNPKNTAKIPGSAPPLGFSTSKTLWLDLGLIGVGAIGLFMDAHEDLAESAIGAGAFGLATTLSFHLAQGSKPTPVNPQAARAPARVGAPAYAHAAPLLKVQTPGLF